MAVAGRRGSEESPSTNTSSFTVSPTFLKTCFFVGRGMNGKREGMNLLALFPRCSDSKKSGFSHMRKGTCIQMEEHFFINGYLSN